jgi:hypothetical protein
MSNNKFNGILIGAFFVMVGGLVGFNVGFDPYGVLGTSSMSHGPSSNERYLKIEHLRGNRDRYEMLIFGSSRSGMTDPKWVEEATGLSAYNASVFSGRPRDMQKLYTAYKTMSGPPRAVMVGLDAMSFLLEPEEKDLSRRHHPSVDEAGVLSYWLDYLLAPSVLPAMEKVAANKAPTITFDFEKGVYALVGYENEILEDHEAYMSKTFDAWKPRDFSSPMDEREWRALNAWMEEMTRDEVEVTIFLQPMHRQWKERMSPLMGELRPLLELVDGLVDLSNVGSEEDELWYEQRHYRAPIARRVVEKLFEGDMGKVVATTSAGPDINERGVSDGSGTLR